MLTRRGLFQTLVGAVAAVFGVKAAPKLALHPKAFSMVMSNLTLFDPQTDISEMFRRGTIGRIDGFDWYEGQFQVGDTVHVKVPPRYRTKD